MCLHVSESVSACTCESAIMQVCAYVYGCVRVCCLYVCASAEGRFMGALSVYCRSSGLVWPQRKGGG